MASVKKVEWISPKTGKKGAAWQVRYTDQFGKDRAKNFKRKKEADDFASSVTVAVKQGIHVPNSQSVSVAEAGEIWIAAVEVGRDGRPPAETSTLDQYRSHLTYHIVPLIGGVRLPQLTTPTVVEFRDELLRSGRSRAMTKKVLTSLKGILSEAQTRGLVGANVALPVKIVSSGREDDEVVIPSKDEIRALVAKAREWAAGNYPPARNKAGIVRHRWFTLFLLTKIAAGLRASEIRGLPWSGFSHNAGTIEVFQRADEKGKIGLPKSKAGYRTIYLPADLVRDLREWRLACPRGPMDLIFPNGTGGVESLANIVNRWWYPLQLAAKVTVLDREASEGEGKPIFRPKYGGLHVLRHFRASVLIEQGADVKEVQRAMGHSSAQVTLDIYGHLFEDDAAVARRQRLAEATNDAVFGG